MSKFTNRPVRFLLSGFRRRSSVIVPVAVLVAVAGIAAMFVAPQPESAAAPSIPSVTWSRAVFNAGGHDSCEYVATVHAEAGTQTEAVERTAAELGLTKVETTSEGIEIRSDPYDCTNENADSGDVSPEPTEGSPEPTDVDPVSFTVHAPFGPFAAAVPAGYVAKTSLGALIVGAVVGTVVAAAIAFAAPEAIVIAAAAVGVTITTETATAAAVCLGMAAGAAIGEYARGGNAQKIVISAVVSCAAGGFISKFKSVEQAESVVSDAVMSEVASNSVSVTGSAAESVSSAAELVPSLAADARAVGESSSNLASAVGEQMRRAASM